MSACVSRLRSVAARRTARWVYDVLGQVVRWSSCCSGNTPVAGQQFEYGFDDIGNRTTARAGGDAGGAGLRVANYTANALNQYSSRDVPGAVDVLGAALPGETVAVNGQAPYRRQEYFRPELPVSNGSVPVWQPVTVTASGESTVSGNVFVPKTQEQFGYDADGNLASDGRWTYSWDAENRLVSLVARTSVGPQQLLKFEYDWRGRRIHKQVWNNTGGTGSPTGDLRFVYDGWNLLAILNPPSSILEALMWGLDLSGSTEGAGLSRQSGATAGGVGGLLEVTYYGTQTTNCFVAFDGNGNVAALVNAADGKLVSQYEYGPFGELLRATGPMGKVNPFRLSGKYQDDETDLLYYGFRYYDPSTGRWLGRDSLEEDKIGPSLYAFASNEPLDYVDRLGLCATCGTDFGAAPPPPSPAPHQCPIGKLDFKRGRITKIPTVAEIKKHCIDRPACNECEYPARSAMSCKQCDTCGAWTIVLNFKSTCTIYFLDPKKVTTITYYPDLDHVIKHEGCHCDDCKQALEEMIAEVGSTQYRSKAECKAAKDKIDLEAMFKNKTKASNDHKGPKWGVDPRNEKAPCFAEARGSM